MPFACPPIMPVLLIMVTLTSHLSRGSGVEPAFVPNPQGRGTFDLLSSCVITLGLCIWTSVHPDVIANKSILGGLWYKLTWMGMAFIVPEISVSNAFHQWREARKFHKDWCRIANVDRGSDGDKLGMEGAFMVVMGGCTVGGWKSGCTAALTPVGFLDLFESNLLPQDILKKEHVKDKAKADALGKLLVCVQALWLVVQSIAREVSGLPVTLLEYHVVIQVGYAIAMYFFWWSKPKDVHEPIEVIKRSDLPEEVEFQGLVRELAQSKTLLMDDLITAGFDGHTDALTAALLAIPTSLAHLVAWNNHFPSVLEMWLWRVSSIGIGVAPICMYLHFVASKYIVQYTWQYRQDAPMYSRVHKLVMDKFPVVPGSQRVITSPLQMRFFEMIFYLTTWINIHSYTLFGIYLGVEAFISLRSVPEGSYQTPVWGNYWPHF